MVALEVDRWLREQQPARDLAGVLRCTWRGDLRDFRMPLPDECLDLVWIDDGTLWLSGPESRSWAPAAPTGATAVGVRFEPGVGPAVLGLGASEVLDMRVRLEELWGDRAARELAERLALQPDDRGRIQELQHTVRQLAVDARPVDEVSRQVAAGIAAPRRVSVHELARSIGAVRTPAPAPLHGGLRLRPRAPGSDPADATCPAAGACLPAPATPGGPRHGCGLRRPAALRSRGPGHHGDDAHPAPADG
jgi:hypothetical protein